jgi:hypothetical protein
VVPFQYAAPFSDGLVTLVPPPPPTVPPLPPEGGGY